MAFSLDSNVTQEADVSPDPAQEQQAETTQPKYVTDEQLSKALTDIQRKMENLYHGVQTRDNKVANRIKQWEDAAKAQGVQLTESQRKLMQDTALIQTIAEESNAKQPVQQVPGQGQVPGNVDQQLIERVNLAAETMMIAADTQIQDNDPENAIIVAAENGSPKDYLIAVQKAIDAKQARLNVPPQAQPQPQPGAIKSPGVVKGVPQSNPIENVNDTNELWKMSFGKS